MENLLKEFTYRRQLVLKAAEKEKTGRLLGFLDWMESVPAIASLLKSLRSLGGGDLLSDTLRRFKEERASNRFNFDHSPGPPDARTLEQIASVGLALVEEARDEEEGIQDFPWKYGITRGYRNDNGPIGGYVVPFFDYIEKRLPAGPRNFRGADSKFAPPAVIYDSLKKFNRAHCDATSTCFIMMRFGKTKAHSKIEAAIKKTLQKHGLVGLLARDREFHDELFPNILTYMHGCDFGIAVYERVETDEFNPNVALEVGYMIGLRKKVLLLKDSTLKALQTDLVGKLYREFDPQSPQKTIPPQIDSWLSDQGLA